MVAIEFPPIPTDAAEGFEGKVVIIGAGVTGLFAANTLKYLGVENFVVLEASDRYGGRLKSCDTLHHDVPLELGAEWIHDADESMVRDMLVFQHDAAKELLPSDFIKYQPEWTLASGRKIGFMKHLYQETKWKRSTWWNWLHTHVYSHVKDKVVLNSPVTNISYDESADTGRVQLTTENGTVYEADKVICTVPLAVLKKGDALLKFSPPLPDQMRQAIEAVEMPPGFRILLEMKEKFYPDLTLVNGIFRQLWNINDLAVVYDPLYGKDLSSSQNLLAFVAIGHESAGSLCLLDEDNLVKGVLEKIDELFDGQGTKNYMGHVLQNWMQEPYILGAYTFPGPEKYRRVLGQTLHNRILFAGEHTSIKYHSLVPGAALEGRRAALEAVSVADDH